MEEESKTEQLWKVNEKKAMKSGPHHSVYWVRRNPEFEEAKNEYGEEKSDKISSISPFKTGNQYVGDWKNNKKHGFGSQTWSCGTKYEGDWVASKRTGRGTLWKPTAKGGVQKQYSGEWLNNKRDGFGTNFYYSFTYQPEGIGQEKISGKAKYTGMWKNNMQHGEGKMDYPNGDVYEGGWVKNKRHGIGRLITFDGNVYEGNWVDGMKEGAGKYHYLATGKVYDGEWFANAPTCGEYRDDHDFPGLSEGVSSSSGGNGPNGLKSVFGLQSFALPNIGVMDADVILGSALCEARRNRSEARGRVELCQIDPEKYEGYESSMREPAFTSEEVLQLEKVFHLTDVTNSGSIQGKQLGKALARIGLKPEEGQIEQLLLQIGVADGEEPVSLEQFVGLLSSLKSKES